MNFVLAKSNPPTQGKITITLAYWYKEETSLLRLWIARKLLLEKVVQEHV